jgi:hypothetical protein
MSKGLSCRVCSQRMTAVKEDKQPMGSWVTYECANPACKHYVQSGHTDRLKERKFEDK